MSSYRDAQKQPVAPKAKQNYVVSFDPRTELGGLAKKSKTFFIMLFGETDKSLSGEFISLEEVMPSISVWHKANIFINEAGQKGQFVNWHFTFAPNDPIVELGYGRERDGVCYTIPSQNTKGVPQRNNSKLHKLFNGKSDNMQFLRTQVHLPVLRLAEDLKYENATPAILIVTWAQFLEIVKLGENYAMSDEADKSLFGKMLQLNKDSSLGTNAYQWLLPTGKVKGLPDMETLKEIATHLLTVEDEVLEGYFERYNGGPSANPEEAAGKVWDYLLQITNLSYDEFVNRYNIKLADQVNTNASSVIEFDDDAPADGAPF